MKDKELQIFHHAQEKLYIQPNVLGRMVKIYVIHYFSTKENSL